MIEPVESLDQKAAPVAVETVGAGALLRRAREASGMHPGALAVMLKVPVHRLEALESERWDLLPDPVFVRALAGSVCRALKVDPSPVLEKLPQPVRQPMHGDAGINAPFRGASDPAGANALVSQVSRPLGLAVAVLLLGALVLIFLPTLQRLTARAPVDTPPAPTAVSAAPVPAGPVGAASVASSAEALSPTVATASSAPPPTTAVAPAAAPSPAASNFATAATPPVSTEKGPSAEPVAKTAGEPIIVFSTKAPSWIQVTDARGTVALKKELGAGETASASGVLPLSVVVGRVDATSVEIRGKTKDLTAIAQNNVARFEVKE